MPKASVKRLIECKKKDLINLVLDIEKYPDFVPFCFDAKIYENKNAGDLTKILDYNDAQKDSINETFSILDTTAYIEDVLSNLPVKLNIGISYIYSNNIHFKSAVQYIGQTAFIGKIPSQISLGLVAFPLKSFSLLGGVSLGGINKINIGSGFNLKVGNFCFHLAGSQLGGLFNSANGVNISSEFRFLF